MTTASERDVFEGIVDEVVTGAELRAARLAEVHRGYVPIRMVFVQRPNSEAVRPSLLGKMVNKRMGSALRALLLIWALEPMLSDARWPLQIWAQLIGGPKGPPSTDTVARAFAALENLKLITRDKVSGAITPLKEDGSGDPYVRPTAAGADVGRGFFIVPHEFWTTGLADKLELPGLAMFLLAHHETATKPTYQISHEKTALWYGVSERTAERGYLELSKANVLMTRTQHVVDRKMRTGTGTLQVTHRALVSPYSKAARESLQAKARAATAAAQAKQAKTTDGKTAKKIKKKPKKKAPKAPSS